ncbi:enoyl-[acyl-carrier-protein] reductase, mitochondrial [Galendromus occidentalis]|uniref:Enoyl-[acyl-carrier-protein] reductase, mitochondrial n=1 Tax=Galendromus occidentalis TaxID=34638 RepID=A0AAJ6QNA7_9ACAR|nr:enoyl-[acyl-carrier-protein] reductase, mitochondrial [Galendromus occidentalis]
MLPSARRALGGIGQARFAQVRLASNFTVKFDEYGDPLSVLKHETCEVPKVSEGSVLLKILASPINPSDINLIQGTYGIKPSLPARAGLEGVGEVIETGSSVKKLKTGDWVLLPGEAWGTWREFGVAEEKGLRKLSNQLDVVMASTMLVNPPSAYRMLKDFVELKPGDTVIQNGANSAVGQAVIQIAKAWGIKTVNIIRDRPDVADLKQQLIAMGADHVITEEELRLPEMKNLFKQIPMPSLALNCIGGRNCSDMMRYVADEGSVVTYGAMSKQPVVSSATALIFKDLRVRGFWRTRWAKKNSGSPEDDSMYEELQKMALDKKLLPPRHTVHKLQNYQEAVRKSMEGFTSSKQILVNM